LESDKHMSAGWIVVPLLQILSVVLVVVIIIAVLISVILTASSGASVLFDLRTLAGILIGFAVAEFILNIFFSFMLYRLVKRRNTHFIRQLFLYEDLETTAKEIAAKKGIDASIPLNNLDRIRRDAQAEERSRDPVLWSAILVFAAGAAVPSFVTPSGFSGIALVPLFAQYYVYYFLMKEWFRHERREDIFMDELSRLLSTVGIGVTRPPRFALIPDRSFAVYLVLTIVTLGFFGIYWVYVLLSDPNNHFRYQAMVEDTIVAQLSGLPSDIAGLTSH